MIFKIPLFIFSLHIFLIGYVTSKTIVKNGTDLLGLEGTLNITSTCGGIIRSNNGRISYKNFDSLEPNERCVWIIGYPGAVGYDIITESIGLSSSVIITRFGRGASFTHIVPSSGEYFYVLDAHVLVITFHTGPENITEGARGFSLLFGAETVDPISNRSEYSIIPAISGNYKFPDGRDCYDDDELSMFVITPLQNSDGTFQKSKVEFVLKGLEEYCIDSLHVHLFNENLGTANKWQHLGELCNEIEFEVVTNRDLILLVFQSNQSVNGTGFHLLVRPDQC